MDTELKYPVGQQELHAAFESCCLFHNIVYRCELTICSDCINITHANTKQANLQVLWRQIELDNVYGAIVEHIAGVDKTGADSL